MRTKKNFVLLFTKPHFFLILMISFDFVFISNFILSYVAWVLKDGAEYTLHGISWQVVSVDSGKMDVCYGTSHIKHHYHSLSEVVNLSVHLSIYLCCDFAQQQQ